MNSGRVSLPFVSSVLVACASLYAGSARTQEAEAGRLEEIIVTARKVEENLQDTPIAISAFSAEVLQERQVFRTDDLDKITPNLQFSNNAPLAGNNASSQVFIRGIGQTDPTSTVDPGVGLYIDDVYMGSAVGGTMDFRDIASVQVLRGPQGTLFGRNTIGGAILLTTTEPGDEFGGNARVSLGSDNLRDGFVGIDVPFTDSLKSRFTIGMRQQDGYVTRVLTGEDLGDTDTYTVTGKLVWTPGDAWRIALHADYTESDENGSPLVFAAMTETATFPRVASSDAGCPGFNGSFTNLPAVPMIQDDRCANDLQSRGPYGNNGTFPLLSKLENYGGALNIAYDVSDALLLKSISSYRVTDWSGIRDADNTPLTILHTGYDVESWQLSQELQLVYQSERLTGVFGLYYFEQESDDIVPVELNTPAPGVQRDSDNNLVQNDSWAAFTQWTWHVSDQWALTVGARYTEDTKGSTPDQFDFATPDIKQLPVQLYKETFTDFTPSAAVNYRWSEAAMAYVSYSEGFKGGGWNSHFNSVQTQAALDVLHQFKPEYAETWEVGMKLDLLDRTLRLNAAVFTTDYTDLQTTYRVVAAPYLTNAGKAGVDGGELEATWLPATNWTFNASVGYLDSELEELDINPLASPPPGLVEGNVLPFAPEWQANAGVAYNADIGSLTLKPRIDASYQSKTYFDSINTREIAQLEDYTVVNASISLGSQSGSWRVTVGVNNATDELYAIAGNSSLTTGSGYAEIAYARPREYFAQFDIEF